IHGRDAVDHEVVLAGAAQPPTVLIEAAVFHTRSKGNQIGEVSASDRKTLDLLSCDRERSLAALRLYERRFGSHRDRFGGSAHSERDRRDADTIGAANHHSRAMHDLERRGSYLDGISVRGDV